MQGYTVLEGLIAGCLNGRALGQGIAEGHAQFERARATSDQGLDQRLTGVEQARLLEKIIA